MVKAHPGYSGTIMTATYQIARDLGWEYFEKLAKQKLMQVQSATDPPKKLALGERAVMADGNEYNALQLKEKGEPIEIVYPAEGTPMIVGPNAIFKNAPNPNAARLLQSYMFSPECQQLVIDVGGLRSVHPLTKEKPGRKPFKIKLMKDDAAGGREAERGRSRSATRRFSESEVKRWQQSECSTTFTRRDVLKAGTALAAATVYAVADPRPGHIECAARRGGHAGADRGGEERGQGRSLHLGRSAAGRKGRARRSRRNIPASPCASSVPAPSACSRASPRRGEQHPRLRRGAVIGRRAFRGLEARGHAGALRSRGRRQALSGRAQGPGWAVRELSRLPVRDGAQHRSGEGGGRAEELSRSARSEMGRQDRQGASGLQRHHPDRDLPDRARRRLGLLREARQAARHAGAVGVRPAQEAGARRARDHGRRHRVRRVPAQGDRQAGRRDLSGRGLAADHRARTAFSRARRTRTPRGCCRTSCSRPNASSSTSNSAACARPTRWSRTSPAARR